MNKTYVVERFPSSDSKRIVDFSCNLAGIPEGSHSILVSAEQRCPDLNFPLPYLFVSSTSSLSVNFTIDIIAPRVSLLSPETKKYDMPNVPLDFTVDEPFSHIAYSLDGEDNMTVAGNTTLSGLSSGEHNVTVYAWDTAGNVGASETVTFTVTDVLQAVLIIAVIVTVIVFSIGLLLFYFKKGKQ
jgi:hypothetical protein